MELTCGMIKYMLEAYRNGELTEEQQAAVLHHILHCEACADYLTMVPSITEF